MKNIFKSGGKRILAGALAAATVASSLPLQSFAEEIIRYEPPSMDNRNNGISTIASSFYDELPSTMYSQFGVPYSLTGGLSAGNDDYDYVVFDASGHPTYSAHHSSTSEASWLLLDHRQNLPAGTPADNIAICIETGAEFANQQKYTKKSITSSGYWTGLQTTIGARATMIALTNYYGVNGKKYDKNATDGDGNVINGNQSDWGVATQVLTWELQQGLRIAPKGTATGTTASTGSEDVLGVKYNVFRERLASTAAKKIYNYLLRKVNAEALLPSFCDSTNGLTDDTNNRILAANYQPRTENNYETLTLKWSKTNNRYEASIKDTNGTNRPSDFKNLSNSYDINVSASKSNGVTTYTFYCDKDTGDKFAANCQSNKDYRVIMGKKATDTSEMAIYEPTGDDYQTVIVGGYNPVTFGIKLKADPDTSPVSCNIVKTFDGKKGTATQNADCRFTIKYEGNGKYPGLTGSNGDSKRAFSGNWYDDPLEFKINSSTGTLLATGLPVGTYTVTETQSPSGYSPASKSVKVTISAGSTGTFSFDNSKDPVPLYIYKTFDGEQGTETQNQACEFTVKEKSSGKYVSATKMPSAAGAGIYTYSGLSATATKFKLEKDSSKGWRFMISGLPTGTYTVTETKYPDGYTPESTSQTITVSKGGNNSVTFNNTQDKGGLKIVKKWIPSDGGSSTSIVISAPALVISKS